MSRFLIRLIAPCLALVLAGSFLIGCDSSDDGEFGTVTGTIMYPDGVTPLGGAVVTLGGATLVSAGPGQQAQALSGPQAITNSQGQFTLEDVPAGPQTLVATRGLFQVIFQVTVSGGGTTTAPTQTVEQIGQFGSIPGTFDSMHNIAEELNIEIEIVNAAIFDDLAAVSEYGMIFLNCSTRITGETRLENVRAYLQNGGTIYISDQSGTTADALVEGLSTGSGGTGSQTIEATVIDDAMGQAIGREEVTITYNLPGWYRIHDLPSGEHTVLLEGTRSGESAPEALAIVAQVGQGQVVFTTFHNTAGLPEDQREVLRYMIGVAGP